MSRSTFTVRASAELPLAAGEDAGPTIDRVLDALETDERALDVGGVACDYATGRIASTFQVELDVGADGPTLEAAVTVAAAIFDAALERGEVASRTTGVAAVEGDDADRLP